MAENDKDKKLYQRKGDLLKRALQEADRLDAKANRKAKAAKKLKEKASAQEQEQQAEKERQAAEPVMPD